MSSAFTCYANYNSTVNNEEGVSKKSKSFLTRKLYQKGLDFFLDMTFTLLVNDVNSFHMMCKIFYRQ